MFQIKGKYNNATVYANKIEETAKEQIKNLLNQKFIEDKSIKIMPDVHAGKGCVIGLTMDYNDIVIPNIIGVDIGCGMLVSNIGNIVLDNRELEKLDKAIRNKIPFGLNKHQTVTENAKVFEKNLKNLKCYDHLQDTEMLLKSIGSLGGGNHFIEVNRSSDNNIYLVIHSGSRNLGHQIAVFYQKEAAKFCQNTHPEIPKELAYLPEELIEDYLHDMNIAILYAKTNRETMLEIIQNEMKFEIKEQFHTIHNYIDTENRIIRKSAISALKGEKIIIPINMRDGSIIAIGKGNKDYNYSAPHGAGRIMSRSKAKENIDLDKFKKDMKGIFTTSIKESTKDEAPDAYKSIDEIKKHIEETVDIVDIIKPIYNFKA